MLNVFSYIRRCLYSYLCLFLAINDPIRLTLEAFNFFFDASAFLTVPTHVRTSTITRSYKSSANLQPVKLILMRNSAEVDTGPLFTVHSWCSCFVGTVQNIIFYSLCGKMLGQDSIWEQFQCNSVRSVSISQFMRVPMDWRINTAIVQWHLFICHLCFCFFLFKLRFTVSCACYDNWSRCCHYSIVVL